MAKKKSKTWYGFKTPRESLRIMEVQVVKETPTRIYLAEDEQRDAMWRTPSSTGTRPSAGRSSPC